ncbi:MMPL family transporter [Pelobacter seleniigenes]|uniref:MMPL family transporter n=1 Tax=Pelobacter seleniigenes TaxID=407188 RepID=UPI0004A71E34|nr:MMPL family transporter [Pelobacter seleniigenes]
MKLFQTCYEKLARRRGRLLLPVLLLLGLALAWLPQLRIGDSIVAMLPDGNSQVARDFGLLQKTPFSRKLVIQLQAAKTVSTADLVAATDQLGQRLPAELFTHLQSGPGDMGKLALLNDLGKYLAVLATKQDLQTIAERLTPEQVDRQMAENLGKLLQPQGVALKEQIRRDPLNLTPLALQKLLYLNPLPGVRIEQGHFISADRRSSLILADTPVLMTDAAGARRLVDAFQQAAAQLPAGISASLLSGHPYTLANTEIIKADMGRVLLVSGIGLLALFLIFLRRRQALSVFLLPFASMLLALVVTSWWYPQLSGITVGFGAVLLGITIDYGLHVYFALCRSNDGRGARLQAVARPLLFGGLTTLVAFAVLLRSELPGQRQLAVFAVTGILVALLLALFVLPQLVGAAVTRPELRKGYRRPLFERHPKLRWTVLGVWLASMIFCAVGAQQLRINGELRRLSYVPPALAQAEQQLAAHWGNMRGRAMIFAAGADLQRALQRNEEVWQRLGRHQLQDQVVSLAPLYPPLALQQQRQLHWHNFWAEKQPVADELLVQAGAKYGFTANAFAPFDQFLNTDPGPLDLAVLQSWGLGDLLGNFIFQDGSEFQVLTLLPDRPELIAVLDGEFADLSGVTLVSQSHFGRQLSRAIAGDFSSFIATAGIVVLILLIVLFRKLADVLLAVLPVLSGLLFMFGWMGWLGVEMNLFNVVASILIIGLGVDYGIFMTCHSRQPQDLGSGQAILVSGLTTLVGFGALVVARHPALYSIGITVLLGICAAVPTAVLVIPAFRPKRW